MNNAILKSMNGNTAELLESARNSWRIFQKKTVGRNPFNSINDLATGAINVNKPEIKKRNTWNDLLPDMAHWSCQTMGHVRWSRQASKNRSWEHLVITKNKNALNSRCVSKLAEVISPCLFWPSKLGSKYAEARRYHIWYVLRLLFN